MDKIEFITIKNGTIFDKDFNEMSINNTIEFKGGIALVYAPNGTGKTSLTKLLDKSNNSNEGEIIFRYNNKSEGESLDSINVIYDQNSRHIIEGEANDFILSSDIVKIKELEKIIDKKANSFFLDVKNYIKNEYGIKTKGDFFIKDIIDFQEFLEKCANSQYRFNLTDVTSLLDKTYNLRSNNELNNEISNYIITEIHSKNKLLQKILELDVNKITKEENLRVVGETSEAIRILNMYKYKEECLICDHEIDSVEVLKRKELQKEKLSDSLSEYVKKSIAGIIENVEFNTPLKIKEILLNALDTGNKDQILRLQKIINEHITNIRNNIHNYIVSKINELEINSSIAELKKLTSGQPKLNDEDIIYLQEIINSHIEKNLKIDFDDKDNKKLKLTLDGENLLNEPRTNLKLSTGEQNFISLAFEFMRSKHLKEEIVVIDDPISSFDSIYKNKIIFCINNLAKDKKCLIFTHNIDLVKLIDAQIGEKYNLYVFQNKENSLNGFINIDINERELLLKLNKLIDFFRADVFNEIINEEYFFMSMIPFIRGYCNFTGNSEIYKDLSGVMHYDKEVIKDIELVDIYKKTFIESYLNINKESKVNSIKELIKKIEKIKKLKFENKVVCNCNSDKIIELINNRIDDIQIFKTDTKYKLLDKTLRHNLIYLSLRLNVEKTLKGLNSKVKIQSNEKLGTLISKVLKDDQKKRVFFMSRKTLVNDFNHFEGNIDIFQPAIDIKDYALKEECNKIINKLNELTQ